jgi:putative membrane protein
MSILLRLIISTITVLIVSYIVPGIHVDTVLTAFVVAVVLAVVNTIIKPVLVLFTLPVTILTLGLFLLVINAGMVLLAAWLVPGFKVDGWLSALLFSLALSIVGGVLQSLSGH